MNARISRSASAPRSAGTAHSISLKRTRRTVDSIAWLASTCRPADTVDAHSRLSDGHSAGTRRPSPHSAPNTVFSTNDSVARLARLAVSGVSSVRSHALVSTVSVCGNQ